LKNTAAASLVSENIETLQGQGEIKRLYQLTSRIRSIAVLFIFFLPVCSTSAPGAIRGSHVPIISHPQFIVTVIISISVGTQALLLLKR
jgi:hypothetical protein